MDISNAADLWLFHLLNAPAGNWPEADRLINALRDHSLLKAGPIVLLWWWLWFSRRDQPQSQALLLAVLVISVPAIAFGRVLAKTLPFRLRPLHEEGLAANLPVHLPEQTLSGWSSMPSDHAVMFFSIAVAIFFVSRLAGSLAVVFALVFVSLPRIYSALHYPSDILIGGLAGAFIAIALTPWLGRQLGRISLDRLTPARHALVTVSAAFMSLQIVTMYEMPRNMLRSLGVD